LVKTDTSKLADVQALPIRPSLHFGAVRRLQQRLLGSLEIDASPRIATGMAHQRELVGRHHGAWKCSCRDYRAG
jgi:hypothetical protein